MVRSVKSKSHFTSPLVPLFGILTVLVIAASYYMANSSGYFDNRSNAAKPVYDEASISIVETAPKLGDYIHFNYVLPKGVRETTGNGTQARIQTMCYQDGNLVYGMAQDAISTKVGAVGEQLGGGSSQWRTNGGPANCVSTLYQWTYKGVQEFVPFATTEFNAAGM